jgi:hypothetical protein
MNVLVVSTSLDPASRSWILAKLCIEELRALDCEPSLLDLREKGSRESGNRTASIRRFEWLAS